MADGQTIKIYSAADIEKYHNGKLSPAEMNAMEKAALEDSFLADAMEGYDNKILTIPADITELKERLARRLSEDNKVVALPGSGKSSFPWMRAAVMTGVLAGAGILAYLFMFNDKDTTIAQADPVKKEPEIKAAGPATPAAPEPGTTAPSATTISTDSSYFVKPSYNFSTEKETKNTLSNAPVVTPENVVTSDSKVLDKEPAMAAEEVVVTGYGTQKKETADRDVAKKLEESKAADDYYAKQTAAKRKAVAPGAPAKTSDFADFKTNIFRGRVTDASNFGVPFAKVTNTEDNVGTYTDARGYFNLTFPDSVLQVQVHSIGFENSVTRLRNTASNNQIILQDDRKLNALVLSNQRPNNAIARSQNNMLKVEEPEPADGWENYDTYIANNVEVPEEYRAKPTAGAAVTVSFEVDKNGEPVNIRVEKSLCEKCDKEAIRLIKEGPKWKQKARNGRTTITIPFSQLF